MAVDELRVQTAEQIGEIAPEIYGHFAEHLGRCIYDGIWVGEDSDVDNIDGIRRETIELLDDLNPPVLRWPGGCFADAYHWRDGIGPREERPRRRNYMWTQTPEYVYEEPNTFGTEEFLQFCREVNAEPYLAVNVGAGSPTEAMNWVEYCNHDGDTELTDLRSENDSEGPHDVTYWGIGNENWGCGGQYDPESYAKDYRRFANYLRRIDDLELIACGHITEGWNEQFLKTIGDRGVFHHVDHLSVHRYYEAGDALEFSDDEYYKLFDQAELLGTDIDDAVETIASETGGSSIEIIVDEWGVWHSRAVNQNGLEQPNTVRDALTAATALDIFNARADVVSMANIAQVVNVLQCLIETDEEAAWRTPTYHVFDLYKPHMGATAVKTELDSESREINDDTDVDLLNGSASLTDDGLYVTVTNRDLDETRSIEIGCDDVTPESATGAVLFGDSDPRSYSTRENADQFGTTQLSPDREDNAILVDVPPSSVAGVEIQTGE